MNKNEPKIESKTKTPIVSPVPAPAIPPAQGQVPIKMRQIVIETDGTDIRLVKAEVSGKIEMIGVLQNLIAFLNQPAKNG